jgi:sugar (pentulose or hexulose) kinase
MILEVLGKLRRGGWSPSRSGGLSFSVRQHDMVLLDEHDEPLIPALSWQANAAKAEVAELRAAGAENAVGKIEERFILPKLVWAIRQQPDLRGRIRRVTTTGDWVAYRLTGQARLSTSDAISNGLLVQATKQLAAEVLKGAGLDPAWFPEVIQSGKVVGKVRRENAAGPWSEVESLVDGWQLVAGLGDNHATGVGCGGLVDYNTIVVSAGTSGTINRRVRTDAQVRGNAAKFEFYDDRMLLMMLADCGEWYKRFKEQFAAGRKDRELSELALAADPNKLVRVRTEKIGDKGREIYPSGFDKLSLGEQTASTQFSIMAELLALVRKMQADVAGGEPVTRFVLTGGLSQSPLFRHLFHAGIEVLAAGGTPMVSDRNDELAHQTAAMGAVINAMLPDYEGNMRKLVEELCPLAECPAAEPARAETWRKKLAADLGA